MFADVIIPRGHCCWVTDFFSDQKASSTVLPSVSLPSLSVHIARQRQKKQASQRHKIPDLSVFSAQERKIDQP